VLKVAFAGEDHDHVAFIGGGDHFVVAHRATGLDGCFRSCFSGGD
jgi:hypothetical protein